MEKQYFVNCLNEEYQEHFCSNLKVDLISLQQVQRNELYLEKMFVFIDKHRKLIHIHNIKNNRKFSDITYIWQAI